MQASGSLTLDNGASRAIQTQGTSLLPIGVESSLGQFKRGDVVDCKNPEGVVIARGLVNYTSEEVSKLFKQPSKKINEIVGYAGDTELIHRDNLVVL